MLDCWGGQTTLFAFTCSSGHTVGKKVKAKTAFGLFAMAMPWDFCVERASEGNK
jgi:hypothetical protein